MSPVARVVRAALPSLIAGAAACAGEEAPLPARLETVVELGHMVQLEENGEVINVTPSVALEPDSGFLIADEREAQLRRYTRDGRLQWHVGRRGSGPGEFRSLARVIRLPSGEVLAAEGAGRFTVFDSAGTTVVRTLRNPFFLVEDLHILDDSTLLVAARLQGNRGQGPSLHLWDVRRDSLRGSFFDPFPGNPNQIASTIAGWTRVAVRGDTIAAIFALSDTLYLLATDGRRLGALPIPFRHFRPVARKTPEGGSDPARRAQWLSTFDYVADVHWLHDGRFVIPYMSIKPDEALTRRWHLFGMDRQGRALFEIRDAPRLFALEPASGTLYFQAPGAEAPNRWSAGILRR